MLLALLEEIGAALIERAENCGRVTVLFLETIAHLKGVVRLRGGGFTLVMRQMAHLGVDSLPIVLLINLFTGMVMTVQTAHEFIKYGTQFSIGGVIAIAMGRELGPVLTGVVMAGRVGAAITAEIGSMKVTEQIDALRVMATNPIQYLVVPRFIACVIMLPLLVVFADLIGTVGGYMVAVYYYHINGASFLNSIKSFAIAGDVTGGLLKAAVFGGIIAIIGCHKGLTTREGAEGVGQATTSSVVCSIILIFVFNYFLSLLLYR